MEANSNKKTTLEIAQGLPEEVRQEVLDNLDPELLDYIPVYYGVKPTIEEEVIIGATNWAYGDSTVSEQKLTEILNKYNNAKR